VLVSVPLLLLLRKPASVPRGGRSSLAPAE
jgi:hypothetical protein